MSVGSLSQEGDVFFTLHGSKHALHVSAGQGFVLQMKSCMG